MKKIMMTAIGCALACFIAGCGDADSTATPPAPAISTAKTPQELGALLGEAMVNHDKDAFLKFCAEEAMNSKLPMFLADFDDEGFKSQMKEVQKKNPVFSGEVKETPRDIEKYGAGIAVVQMVFTIDGNVSTGPYFIGSSSFLVERCSPATRQATCPVCRS